MRRPFDRYELIELPIPANPTATRFNFPDIPQLRDDSTQDIVVRAIDTYDVVAMPLTPNGNLVASLAQILNTFLVLYIRGEEAVHWVPLARMLTIFQNGAGGTQQAVFEQTLTDNLKVDWTKSYLWAAAPYGTVSAFSFVFGFEYKKYPPGTLDALTAAATAKLVQEMAMPTTSK